MSAIPSNYPSHTLSSVGRAKLEWFCRRYVEEYYNEYRFGHFFLAAYAAVPALLTPDLLYKIWQNFSSYKWNDAPATIHRVAVSDILLSPFCRETGFELYEMDQDIRLAFLEWLRTVEEDTKTLWKDRGISTIKSIANFVHEYHLTSNSGTNRWGVTYSETQELEALSYLDPEKVAGIFFDKLNKQSAEQQETELLRTMDLFVKTNNRLSRILPEDSPALSYFNENVDSITAYRDLFQQNSEAFLKQLETNNSLSQYLSEIERNGAIKLNVPAPTAKKVEETKAQQPPKVRALIVGIHSVNPDTPGENGTAEGENDAKLVEEFLNTYLPGEELEMIVLLGSAATKSNILKALNALAERSTNTDDIVFYVSSKAMVFDGHCHILCHDSFGMETENAMSTMLSDSEFNNATARIRRNNFVAILELPYSGTRYWLNMDKQQNNLVFTSCTSDQMPLISNNTLIKEKSYSFFTSVLISEWNKAESFINYRHLFKRTVKSFEELAAVKNTYENEQRVLHRPQMYCSSSMLQQVLSPRARDEARLQTLLRQTGFYNDRTTGIVDRANQALIHFCEDQKISIDTPRRQLIGLLEAELQKQATERSPLCLLIFSDPRKTLIEIDKEREKILNILNAANIDYKCFVDPDKKAVEDYVRDVNNRNRIKMVYYSGNDIEGGLQFKSGTLQKFGLTEWLDYQENIELFIANTCSSQYLAETLSQQGIRMSIGVEGKVRDQAAAEFGELLFSRLVKLHDMNTFAEFYWRHISLKKDNSIGNLSPYKIFTAPWANTQDTFTIDLKRKEPQTGKKANELKKVFALSVSVGYTSDGKSFTDCVANNRRFAGFLEEYCPVLNRELQLVALGKDGFVHRAQIEEAVELFNQAEPGDTCVFFYSGPAVGHADNVSGIICSDDPYMSDGSYNVIRPLEDMLSGILMRSSVHLLLILDINGIFRNDRNYPPIEHFSISNSSTIIQGNRRVELAGSPAANNYFFTSLMDLLQEGGYRLSYDNLFYRMKLRLSQLNEQAPKFIYPGESGENRFFLTGEENQHHFYTVSFDAKYSEWVVNAGARQGIRPSLDFMPTIFETEQKVRVTVKEVSADKSTLQSFEGDTNQSYQARLIQNALPKVKVAFDPEMGMEMRARLQKTIGDYSIYYIDIIETVQAATFLIAHHERGYMLIRTAELQGPVEERKPVFDYQYEPYEFIKQIEYIAQWQGVLEFDNPESGLDKSVIWFDFEKLEGPRPNKGAIDLRKYELFKDSEPVVLNYKYQLRPTGDGEWVEPRIKCKATRVTKAVHVTVLYLDAMYEIKEVSQLYCEPNENKYITFDFSGARKDNPSIRIDKHYIDRGITEIYEYMKFFVSEKPIDIKALEQDALESGDVIRKGFFAGDKNRRALDITASDWIAMTIPIKIVRREPEGTSFMEVVEKIYKETPVTVADDLQKGRWGGQANANGKALSAKVTPTGISQLYNFTVTVSTEPNDPLANEQVAIFLHNTFGKQIRYGRFNAGVATFIINGIYESFTIGAYTEDGTRLELDLNEQPGLPKDFYYPDAKGNFRQKVHELYNATPIKVTHDIQKDRWGGTPVAKGKKLSATVSKTDIEGFFRVTLVISPIGKSRPLTGSVAFFMHSSFTDQIVFRKAVNGKATIVIHAYEAFTVGAYTSDDTMLELDLNSIDNAPKEFYSNTR